jgi:hypothetical protein
LNGCLTLGLFRPHFVGSAADDHVNKIGNRRSRLGQEAQSKGALECRGHFFNRAVLQFLLSAGFDHSLTIALSKRAHVAPTCGQARTARACVSAVDSWASS